MNRGFFSVEQLRTKQGGLLELTHIQKIGLKHYEALKHKIPRDEVIEISQVVKEGATKEFGPGVLRIETCGSYRRGRTECGDVDVLVTTIDPHGKVDSILQRLTTALERQRFLIERLGKDKQASTGAHTYLGICKVKKEGAIARRVDIKVYPTYQFGFAIMYFTGSMQLNLAMRGIAI